ncbi:MAG: hypothetical protein ACYDCK_08160 [Thermoplasmatota archaeon]
MLPRTFKERATHLDAGPMLARSLLTTLALAVALALLLVLALVGSANARIQACPRLGRCAFICIP